MDQNRSHQATWIVPIITATIGIALAGCVVAHASWLNGSWYWRWPWRDRASLPAVRWYAPMLPAALPIVMAWFVTTRSKWRTLLAIALLMLGVFAMKLVSVAFVTSPASFAQLAAIVRSPDATSYYSDAAALQDVQVPLAIYPEIISLPSANLHTRSKPPGAVMYYLGFIHAYGFGDRSAIIAGIVLGALATLSIPATYWLAMRFAKDRSTALLCATLLAMCPGYLFHFPTFDATYPILAAALIGLWHLAITRDDWRLAIGVGVVLGIITFITYNLLVLGAVMIAGAVGLVSMSSTRRRMIQQIVLLAILALVCFVAFYVVLWIYTGFDPIATFRAALRNQNALLAQHADQRPYPATIWFDLVDFALGMGWIVLLPAMFGIARLNRERTAVLWPCVFGVELPVLVAIIGVLQAETSRVWIFMLPMFLLPAAVELRRWSPAQRTLVFATLLMIALAVGHNMLFLIP